MREHGPRPPSCELAASKTPARGAESGTRCLGKADRLDDHRPKANHPATGLGLAELASDR
jgi:hypothetical protein